MKVLQLLREVVFCHVSDLSPAQAAEIRGEIDDLRRRVSTLERSIDILSQRLDTRIAAAELKQHNDSTDQREQLHRFGATVGDNTRRVGNVESLQRASHAALMHLMGVIARAMKVPDEEISKAMHMAGQ